MVVECVLWFKEKYPNIPIMDFEFRDICFILILKPKLIYRHGLSIDLWRHGLVVEIRFDNYDGTKELKKQLESADYQYNNCSSVDEFTLVVNKYLESY